MTDNTAPERVAEDIARAFHEVYESLAPQFGYETREDSRVPWDEVPERNRALMVKTVEALFELGVITPTAPLLRWLDEQEKATMDEHRNFRSGYDEGRFDAFETVEAHIEGRDTHE